MKLRIPNPLSKKKKLRIKKWQVYPTNFFMKIKEVIEIWKMSFASGQVEGDKLKEKTSNFFKKKKNHNF